MKVQILVDNLNSWMIPYAKKLTYKLRELNIKVQLLHNHEDIEHGDILCLLSCEKIFYNLELNKHNIVVHESALPFGKGWSPMTWQVIEGKNKIPVTLFEANKEIDSGNIYDQKFVELDGTELIEEIRFKQAQITEELILSFIKKYPFNIGVEQKGDSNYFPKRKPQDSKLNINLSLKEQINLLRVCDNNRYPAFFVYKNQKYILKILKDD